jgi:dTDP-4-dehydrorhamnose reductase
MGKKKILLFGATGMAGHLIYLFLKNTGYYEITPVVYRNRFTSNCIVLDVSDKNAVLELIRSQKADYVINCVGVLIKGANTYPDNAILLNSYFPHLLAKIADEVGSKLIHISTDCVFSGKKGAYSESDFRDADDIYGRSKSLGEIFSNNHLTLRTSIIGPEIKADGEGLFHWFMHQSGTINGFTNAYWGGVTTLELAKAINKAIKNDLTGLMHVTNGDRISKYDLVKLFKDIWNRHDISISEYAGKSTDKSLLKSAQFDFDIPGYKEMLIEQKAWMDSHGDLYNGIYSGQ